MVGALVAVALSACPVAAYAQESKQKSSGVTGAWTGKSSARCAMTSYPAMSSEPTTELTMSAAHPATPNPSRTNPLFQAISRHSLVKSLARQSLTRRALVFGVLYLLTQAAEFLV